MIEIQRSGRTVALWDEERQKLYPMVSGGVSAPAGGNARPGVPTWARQNANYAYGMDTDPTTGLPTGFLGQAMQSGQQFPWANYLGMLGAPLNAANLGGSMQRQLSSSILNDTLGQLGPLIGASQAGIGDISGLMGQQGNFQGAAQQIAQNINRGATGLQGGLAQANQSLQNVMDPTMYNPLFQNAMANQITPQTNAAFSSRGLGSSGANLAALQQGATNLSDQFAQRQFQEQLGAQQNVGNLSGALGQLGVQGSQVPGAIFNQFMSGLGQGQGALGQAAQNQLAPLGALSLGSQQYWQGVNNPLNAIMNVSGFTNQPLSNVQSGVASAMGNIGSPTSGWMQKALGKA